MYKAFCRDRGCDSADHTVSISLSVTALSHIRLTSCASSASATAIEDHAKLMYQLQQDSTRVPVWICLLLLLSYMGAGATVFCVYNENWSFVDSFYFAFAILWTIGMYV